MPAALAQPAAFPRPRGIDDVIVLLLEAPEPGGGVRLGAHVPDQFGAAGPPQLIGEPHGEIDRVDVLAVRHEGKHPRAAGGAVGRVAAPQAPGAEAGHGERELARAGSGFLEDCVRQEQELRVPQRAHRGAVRLAEQPAGLAHQLAALDLSLEAGAGGPADAQPSAREQIYSLGRGTRFEQHIARRQGEMHGTGRERLEGRLGQVLEIDAAFETVDGPAQFLQRARWFFLQGHGRFSGRTRLIL